MKKERQERERDSEHSWGGPGTAWKPWGLCGCCSQCDQPSAHFLDTQGSHSRLSSFPSPSGPSVVEDQENGLGEAGVPVSFLSYNKIPEIVSV